MAETPNRVLPVPLTTSTQTIYTAGGAGTWTVIRQIRVVCVDAVQVTVHYGIGTSNTDTAAKRIGDNVVVLSGKPYIDSGGDDGPIVLKGHATTPDLLYALIAAGGGDNNDANIYVSVIEGP